ncbi:MAG: glycerophosphodiester phosphodiesterase family protein [Alistipes sp.]|nr:glycerophosphodiester phosphodiesterase family protein [Alistipes sp.]
MKKSLFLAASGLLLSSCATTPAPSTDGRAASIVAALHDPATDRVLVASHRGDWRNWPENSIPAIESVIAMGVDIMELDLKLTADSVLVLCHDKSIDRTTSGKGLVCEIDYDSIRRCVLRTGHNVKTAHRMPTLREALAVCKDRIVVNVDQGYEYYDLVLALTEELGMTDQVLIKGKHPVAAVAEKFAEHPRNMMYMPIVDILKPQGKALFDEYRTTGTVPLAYEVCWDRLTPEVEACMREVVAQGSRLWVNSLWPSLCGGLDDDTALTSSCEEVYGRLVGFGATLIQTDRPELLLNYLRSRGLHD